jgi:DUF438 domain-containing protein
MSELIDNRAYRIQTLKGIIQHLHAGKPPDQVRATLREIVRRTDAVELISMEQELLAGGMPVDELRSMCDLHSQVTRDVLVNLPESPHPPGHPVDTFRRENAALREVTAALRSTQAEVAASIEARIPEETLLRWRRSVNDLTDIDKHYQRKEHALFSKLEKHGIHGPSKVMWAKDDEVRRLIQQLQDELRHCGTGTESCIRIAQTLGTAAVNAVEEMIHKEENILLPMSLKTLTEEDWAEIWASSPQYGWCLVAPREGWKPARPALPETVHVLPDSDAIQMPTGHVSLRQLVAVLGTLPVDLTFVDADDRVAFFSEGPSRVFARSRAIVGRKVQNCHPPSSVEVVDRILADFRSGAQSVAEFWINFKGRFVHIRYFAVRDDDGAYLGTLEVTQDVSAIRTLTGERRLLEYTTEGAVQ